MDPRSCVIVLSFFLPAGLTTGRAGGDAPAFSATPVVKEEPCPPSLGLKGPGAGKLIGKLSCPERFEGAETFTIPTAEPTGIRYTPLVFGHRAAAGIARFIEPGGNQTKATRKLETAPTREFNPDKGILITNADLPCGILI